MTDPIADMLTRIRNALMVRKETKLVLTLKYADGRSVIGGLKRVSKPGLRTYSGAEDMPKVLGGFGIAIVSTNQGIMTDKQARRQNVGGEVLCCIW